MTELRDAQPRLRLALAVLALLVVAILVAGWQLHRLSISRAEIHRRSQGNLEQSRAAIQAQGLVAQQEVAIRDLVLASDAADIREAEDRFESLGRGYAVVQDRLLGLFASDPKTSDGERALLDLVKRERLKTIEPYERVVALALRNQDELATRILIEEVLPNQTRLRTTLADLDALQQTQSRTLERIADQAYSLAAVVTIGLAALAALTVGIVGWLAARAMIARRSSRVRSPAGATAMRASS